MDPNPQNYENSAEILFGQPNCVCLTKSNQVICEKITNNETLHNSKKADDPGFTKTF